MSQSLSSLGAAAAAACVAALPLSALAQADTPALPRAASVFAVLDAHPDRGFQALQTLANAYFAEHGTGRGSGYKQYKRWEYFARSRVSADGQLVNASARALAAQEQIRTLRQANTGLTGQWEAQGPSRYFLGPSGYNGGLGRINVIRFAPDDPRTIYVGTPAGGLLRTRDGGITWEPLTDGLPAIGVSGIAVHPQDPDTLYLLTGDGDGRHVPSIGVLKSEDGGNTWQNTGLQYGESDLVYGYKLAMSPADPDVLLAATSSGLQRSSDGGNTWTETAAGDVRDLEFHPRNSNIVYMAFANAVYRSLNNGVSWSSLGNANGLPTFPNTQRIALAVTRADPNRVYALYGGDNGYLGLYRSRNAGSSFERMSDAPNLLGYDRNGNDTASLAWYGMGLAASPTDPDIVDVGGVNMWRSTDGGVTWTNASYWVETDAGPNYTHADIHEVVYRGPILYVGSDGGIFRSRRPTSGWQDLSAGLQITQIYEHCTSAQNDEVVYFGTQDNGSNDLLLGPESEMRHVFGADGGECQIDPSDPDTVYIEYQFGGLLRSTDGGNNFSGIQPIGSGSGYWITPIQLSPVAPSTLYGCYTDLYRSTNRGSQWSNVSTGDLGGDTCIAMDIAASDGAWIYVLKSDRVYRTSNGGAQWRNVTAGLPAAGRFLTDIAVDPQDSRRAWVTFSGYDDGDKVFVTDDGGVSWSNLSGGLPNLPVNTIAAVGSNGGVLVGLDVGVYYRDESMNEWAVFADGLPNVIIEDLTVNPVSGQVVAGTFGRGLWRSPLPDTLAREQPDRGAAPRPD